MRPGLLMACLESLTSILEGCDSVTFKKITVGLGGVVPLMQYINGRKYEQLAELCDEVDESGVVQLKLLRNTQMLKALGAVVGVIKVYCKKANDGDPDAIEVSDKLDAAGREQVLFMALEANDYDLKVLVMECLQEVPIDNLQAEEVANIVNIVGNCDNLTVGRAGRNPRPHAPNPHPNSNPHPNLTPSHPHTLTPTPHPRPRRSSSSLTAHRSPLTAHRSPLTAHRSPLTAHHSPLTALRSPSPQVGRTEEILGYTFMILGRLAVDDGDEGIHFRRFHASTVHMALDILVRNSGRDLRGHMAESEEKAALSIGCVEFLRQSSFDWLEAIELMNTRDAVDAMMQIMKNEEKYGRADLPIWIERTAVGSSVDALLRCLNQLDIGGELAGRVLTLTLTDHPHRSPITDHRSPITDH